MLRAIEEAGLIDDDEELDWGEEGPPKGPRVDLVADSGAVRTARYDGKRRQRGQVRVSVWVPGDRVSELREIVARWTGKTAV